MANIRKSKSATASLFIFILVAALLLNIGLMVITQINPFFDSKVEQLNDPHAAIMMHQESYDPTYCDFIANYPGVTETEAEKIIAMDIAKFKYGTGALSNSAIIFNADAERKIGPLNLIEKLNALSSEDIFVPYSFKTSGAYELGDPFTITYLDKDYSYRIGGFFETTMMGTNNMGVMKFMLPEDSFDELAEELDASSEGMILSAVLEDLTQSSQLEKEFMENYQQTIEETSSYIWGLNVELVKSVNTLTINIVATLLVAFAIIIVLVSLIVIKYRISNSIEDGMTNIGVLKAIGYTSRQILSSMILQFSLIALCGSVGGIALSYVLMPFFGGIISTLSGLIWVQRFDLQTNLICIVIVAFCVLIVALLSAFRVKKILPVAALRGGIQTHNFKKNNLPLDKAKGGLHFLLAIKSLLANAKQNMMILLIISALTFASVFSLVLYYNIASDKSAFVDLFGAEPANVYIAVMPDEDPYKLLDDIEQMDAVRKVNLLDMIETKIDGQTVYTNVADNYSRLESNMVYEGRQPKHDNEISISWVVSDLIDKKIGDTVEVTYGNETKNYLVTGLSQSMSYSGTIAGLTMEGIRQLQSGYKGTTLYVYLDGITNKDFIERVQDDYGNRIVEAIDIDENIESQTGIYTAAVFAVVMMVLIITVLVVAMILYLVIKTMIIKRKKEFGILKALGFSTVQLMNQISISFLPVIVAGVIIGGLLGLYFTNPMLSVLLSTAGVKSLEFIIHPTIVLMICAGILILAYIVSMLVSGRIKKISAYGLITE
ncbi:ABC transporter permease [Lysinibacillus yapensis]|uniref:ABC transporter permease n=1 Tax=Ureibacillus yapensis TaxID=2304605 RepID=A0A396S4B3_9BACL|nr:ABC transporter permease [Lysinibacillus yapensis]